MYRVMIADDEGLIVRTLQSMIPWNELGYEVIGCYQDGSQLLEALEYTPADLIVTDIRMSLVSGLEIAKYVQKQMPYCKVVIISGYQEFELAVEAIQYGVIEYIPKPLSLSRMEECLKKAAQALDVQRADLRVQEDRKRRMEQMQQIMEEKLFAELAFGGPMDFVQTEKLLRTLYPEIGFGDGECFLFELRISDYEEYLRGVWKYSRDQLENNLGNFFEMYRDGMVAHLLYKSYDVLGVFGIAADRAEHPSERIERLRRELLQIFRLETQADILREYPSLRELTERKSAQSRDPREGENTVLLREIRKQFLSEVGDGNLNAAQTLLRGLFGELSGYDPGRAREFTAALLDDMASVLRMSDEALAGEVQKAMDSGKVWGLETAEQLQSYLERILDRMKLAGAAQLHGHAGSFVEQAKRYVMEHITQDISREDVAEALFICSTYLSRIFRRQTGETFNQFLTRMKVEKAIELLKNPQYKVYEVCDFLGYKTPRYFSGIFRMHTGMNPSEYRKAVLHLEVAEDEKA